MKRIRLIEAGLVAVAAALAIAIVALTSGGCSLASPGVEYPEACGYYDSAYLGWSATASAASGLAGAAGTASASVGGLLDGDTARDAAIGLGVGGAVLGVVATVAGLLAGEYAARFAERCSTPEPTEPDGDLAVGEVGP